MNADFNRSAAPAPEPGSPGPTTWMLLRRYWWESVRYQGWVRTTAEFMASLWRALLDLTPRRRKTRFGDLDFDWESAADTTRSNVSLRVRLLTELLGRPYFASEPWLFQQIMDALPPEARSFTFIDMGSGKGRALLMAAEAGFQRIVGVEYMADLHRIAENNIVKFQSKGRCSAAIQTLSMDARDFRFPPGPFVLYLFNPFARATFAAVLENLRESLHQSPRPIYIAYRSPEFEDLLQRSDWLERIVGTEQWCIYKDRPGC